MEMTLRRVAVLDVDGLPSMHGVEVGRAAIMYQPGDGSPRRIEVMALVELDEADRGYVDGSRAYITTLVVHVDAVRPIEHGSRVNVRPPGAIRVYASASAERIDPADPLLDSAADPGLVAAASARMAEVTIGSKWRGRKTDETEVFTVFGVSGTYVAYESVTREARYASVKPHWEFHQRYQRIV